MSRSLLGPADWGPEHRAAAQAVIDDDQATRVAFRALADIVLEARRRRVALRVVCDEIVGVDSQGRVAAVNDDNADLTPGPGAARPLPTRRFLLTPSNERGTAMPHATFSDGDLDLVGELLADWLDEAGPEDTLTLMAVDWTEDEAREFEGGGNEPDGTPRRGQSAAKGTT